MIFCLKVVFLLTNSWRNWHYNKGEYQTIIHKFCFKIFVKIFPKFVIIITKNKQLLGIFTKWALWWGTTLYLLCFSLKLPEIFGAKSLRLGSDCINFWGYLPKGGYPEAPGYPQGLSFIEFANCSFECNFTNTKRYNLWYVLWWISA